MTDRIAAHVFADSKCVHCGVPAEEGDKSCIYRDAPPRAKPTSIFDDLAAIGARAREIATEEDKARANS